MWHKIYVLLIFGIQLMFVAGDFELKHVTGFVRKYLEFKWAQHATIFLCERPSAGLLQRYLNELPGIPIQIYHINDVLENLNNLKTFETIMEQQMIRRQGLFLSYNCPNSSDLLLKASYDRYFQDQFKWLIIEYESLEASQAVQQLATLNVSVDADITVALGTPETFTIYDVWSPGYVQGGELVTDFIGEWSQNQTLLMQPFKSKYYHRIDFKQILMKASFALTERPNNISLYDYLFTRIYPERETMQRYAITLVQSIKSIHNFRIIYRKAKTWFGKSDAVPEGIQKHLVDRQADFSAVPAILYTSRVGSVDWASPIWPYRTGFLLQNPERPPGITNVFISPFAFDSWYSLMALSVLFIVSLRYIYSGDSKRDDAVRYGDSWTSASITTFGAFCQQGTSLEPQKFSGKFVLVVLMIGAVLLYNYYTSSILSFLINAKPITITTVRQLIDSGLSIALHNFSHHIPAVLNASKDKVVQELNHKIWHAPYRPWIPVDWGIALLKKGGWAFHAEVSLLFPKIAKQFDQPAICRLSEVVLTSQRVLPIFSQEHGPLTDTFKISFERMREGGIINREVKHWQQSQPACNSDLLLVAVALGPTSSAFFILIFGAMASIFILILEMHQHYVCLRFLTKRGRTFPVIE